MAPELLQVPARQAATLEVTGHRPWPLPDRSWLLAQTCEQLLFAHWRMPVERLRRHLPDRLDLDTFEGDAWLGVTPFRVANLRLRGLPPLPGVSSFLQLNCRTYVSHGGRPGIWLFSLDASSRLAVESARWLYGLPFFLARMHGLPHFRCTRLEVERPHVWESTYEPAGEAVPAEAGTLAHFLTERYCLYTVDGAGALHRADIHHLPWPLQPARAAIALNTVPPDGLETDGDALCHYAELQDVLIWEPEQV